ncbi:response regulator transcription factor [Microbacterium sp. A84]|uniref:response regulator transcription factor n=1 Tax=Microbacterium sp. A84 TaxID=3450715 RepID=UPI003F41F9A7
MYSSERFIVVDADLAADDNDGVRAWTRQSAVATMNTIAWLDARLPSGEPIASAGVLWRRGISYLHSQGQIDDARLHRELQAANESGHAAAEGLARIAQDVDHFVIVVDASAVEPDLVAELETDFVALLSRTTHVRGILIRPQTSAEISPVSSDASVSSRPAQPPCNGAYAGLWQIAAFDAAQTFIRATSDAPYLDIRLAKALTGQDDVVAQLDLMAQQGIGAWRAAPDGKRTFHYSDVVREWSQSAAESSSDDRRKHSTAAIIARWLLEERFEPPSALAFAVRSGDIDLIAAAGLRTFPFTPDASEVTTDLIRRLPRSEQLAHPMLALWIGVQLALQPDGAERAITQFRVAGTRGNVGGRTLPRTERMILMGMQAYVLRRAGRASASRSKARSAYRKAAKLIVNGDVDVSLNQIFVTVVHQVGVSLLYAGESEEAGDLYRLLFEYCEENGLGHRRNSSASVLAFIAADGGATREAERWLEQVTEDDWPSAWRTGYTRTYFDLAEMLIAINRADLPRLESVLARFIQFESETEHWDVVVFAQVCAELIRGDASAALTWFNERVRERLADTTHPWIRERLRRLRLMLQAAGTHPRQEIPGRVSAAEGAAHAALEALIATREGNAERAVAKVVSAGLTAQTPLEQSFATIASLLVARYSDYSIDFSSARAKLHVLCEIHGLHFPLVFLAESEREALISDSGIGVTAQHALHAVLDKLPTCVQADDAWGVRRSLLTRQELAVLRALCDHTARADIAQQLHLSLNTVKVHLGSVYRKLGVHSRAEALVAASLLGVLPEDRQ